MNKIFKLFFFLSIAICISYNAKAQGFYDKENAYFLVGGNLGLNFSSYSYTYEISPEVSYRINEYTHLGLGGMYAYYKEKQNLNTYSATILGYRLFSRVFPIDNYYVHLEYERTFYKDPYTFNPNGSGYQWEDAVNVGIGAVYGDVESSFTYVAILYNVMNKEFFPGYNPFFRFGMVFAIQ